MATAGSTGSLGIWAIVNCALFLSLGIFFIGVAYCFPGMNKKEMDAAGAT